MKNGTKIAIVAAIGIGIALWLRSKRTNIAPNGAGNASAGSAGNASAVSAGNASAASAGSAGSAASAEEQTINPTPATTGSAGTTTNAGTTLTGANAPTTTTTTTSGTLHNTNITLTPPPISTSSGGYDPCAPKTGNITVTYNVNTSPNINITRIRQQCVADGGQWFPKSTGGCCVKKQVTPTINAPTISTTQVFAPSNTDSCFVSDTLITMCDDSKVKIQDIVAGMDVLSFNEETKNQEISKVLEVSKSSVKSALITIKTKSGIEITSTPKHPFWLSKSSIGHSGWCDAFLIEKGECLLLENGQEEEIVSVEVSQPKEIEVYNLSVADNKTYYANSILVHNKDLVFDQTYYGQQAQDIVMQLQNMFQQQYQQQGQYNTGNVNSGYYTP